MRSEETHDQATVPDPHSDLVVAQLVLMGVSFKHGRLFLELMQERTTVLCMQESLMQLLSH